MLVPTLVLLLSAAPSASLRVSAAGDLQLGARTTPAVLEALPSLLEGDVRVVNLEGPLTARAHEQGLDADGTPRAPRVRFAAPPSWAHSLAGRVDVVSLENNHALDAGVAGRQDTAGALRAAGIQPALAREPASVERQGLQVTVLARDLPREPTRDEARALTAAVRAARKTGPVLLSLHWGTTNSNLPTRAQRTLAHALIEAGASAVLGHGPHAPQGVERHGQGVIAYSLGNLAFSCRCTAVKDAYVLRFQLAADGAVSDVSALPLRAGLAGEAPGRATDSGVAELLISVSEALGTHTTTAPDGTVVFP
ncbi:CapA family protein [Corallococcus sp. M34]|uniref:CapA family protein n=1 Tax=Citreicoccus inhibens TaxID=2849499 RepID=UPI001C23BC72|nr:CapA family protein [Citreicoccus inhibens]MBU8898748.1 CapA family protein [Citreicoccus inhibens]